MKLKSLVHDPRERTRFLKFSAVGALGALVDFGSFHLLISLGIAPAWAQAGSFSVAVTSNFIWNRLWTYPDSRTKSLGGQLASFFLVNLVGLGIRTPIFTTLERPLRKFFSRVGFLPLGPVTPDRLGYTFALGFAILVVLFWNFFINRIWTYNDVE